MLKATLEINSSGTTFVFRVFRIMLGNWRKDARKS
jgi:hypothetical protein